MQIPIFKPQTEWLPPEEFPESAAFLEITDERPGQSAKLVFSGWMFASSPALAAMAVSYTHLTLPTNREV